jgi:hypothetical protein
MARCERVVPPHSHASATTWCDRSLGIGGGVAHLPRMKADKRATGRKTTLDTILSTVERGFAAISGDIADIKSTMATKDDVRAIVAEELAPIHANSNRFVEVANFGR